MYPRGLDREDAVTSGHHENGMDVGRLGVFKLKGGKCAGGWKGKAWESFPLAQFSITPSLIKYAGNSARNISTYRHFWITSPGGFSKFKPP